MKTITIEKFMEFDPCYPEEKIQELAGGKQEWTALDILALDTVPAEDRLWAVLREELIDTAILHEFACRCAEMALARVDNPDQRSIDAIAAKRAWLRGEMSDDQLDAARDAARDAAWAAAWAVARSAARDAARSAARDAVEKYQVEVLIEILEGAR